MHWCSLKVKSTVICCVFSTTLVFDKVVEKAKHRINTKEAEFCPEGKT